MHPRTEPRSDAGLTLLELLVTAGILSLLMGLGVGYLRRSDGLPEAKSAIVGLLRMAALDARTRGLPTEVRLVPGQDGAPPVVLARGLDPVVLVTFESGQRFLDASLEPAFGGEEFAQGRIGKARTPKDGDKRACVRLSLGRGEVDFREGFAFRLDVRLLERKAGSLLRLGNAVTVQLDDSGRPSARLAVEAEDGRGAGASNLQSQSAMPAGRWCTFELGADGDRAWIAIDGRTVAEQNLRQRLRQQKEDALEVLPGEDAVPAAVDELQVFAYAQPERAMLSDGVALKAAVRIAFDTQGEPVAPPEISLVMASDGRTEVLRVGPGGVLQ